ncbi:MAG: UbiX family flavin prenyltransferase [Actinobacteria bacterium]|nr:UbiX family flavin prenyltransferase [Actinomycetota bacterium]
MKRLIVGISGASGTVYGVRLLETLQRSDVETHLVMTESTRRVIRLETGFQVEAIEALADFVHDNRDIGAPIASGSFLTSGMVVAPCSMKSLSAIAHSYNENLLIRAADVVLKESRKLVLVTRETPLHIGHLRLMTQVAEAGGIILPPMPSFYHQPETIDDIVNQTVGKVLDQFEIEHDLFRRWEGTTVRMRTRQGEQ